MTKIFKPDFPQLAIVEWLHENLGRCFVTVSNSGSRRDFDAFMITDEKGEGDKKTLRSVNYPSDEGYDELNERIGGFRDKLDLWPLAAQGILNHGSSFGHASPKTKAFESYVSQFESPINWYYNSRYYTLNREHGVTWWQTEGVKLIEKARKERAAKRAKANRLVLVGRVAPIPPVIPEKLLKQLPDGFKFPIPERRGLRPQAYATVYKETDKRLYLEDIHYVRKVDDYGRHDASVIQGYREKFVEREHVILDNADAAIIGRITALDVEYQQDVTRIATEFAERILPILQDLNSRFLQKDSEREEVIAEAIEAFRKKSAPKASPKAKKPGKQKA